MHAMNWHMGMALGGIRLQVPDSQVVRALEVLDDFEPEDAETVALSHPEEEEADDEIEEVACCPGVRVAGNSRDPQPGPSSDYALVGSHPFSRAAHAVRAPLEVPDVRLPVARKRRIAPRVTVLSGEAC